MLWMSANVALLCAWGLCHEYSIEKSFPVKQKSRKHTILRDLQVGLDTFMRVASNKIRLNPSEKNCAKMKKFQAELFSIMLENLI